MQPYAGPVHRLEGARVQRPLAQNPSMLNAFATPFMLPFTSLITDSPKEITVHCSRPERCLHAIIHAKAHPLIPSMTFSFTFLGSGKQSAMYGRAWNTYHDTTYPASAPLRIALMVLSQRIGKDDSLRLSQHTDDEVGIISTKTSPSNSMTRKGLTYCVQ